MYESAAKESGPDASQLKTISQLAKRQLELEKELDDAEELVKRVAA